ncbi:hypothetical protein RGE_17840 [Rubrivivax gelatinosus IL144]|uniref:Uncharacterized protein n=1 Tax=Rubrivivax gelatinosus (strain NBRC 100245 / IL144) TaxID=983917 RepID=I0HQ38_RUBGI|nr:hypothetical protein RGE_17840 [Rubrivivax gelatinosus IL144]
MGLSRVYTVSTSATYDILQREKLQRPGKASSARAMSTSGAARRRSV